MFRQQKRTAMFILVLRRLFLSVSLASLLMGCSQMVIQSREEGPDSGPIPDCRRNHSREGGLISLPLYSTWVEYDRLEFKRAFELAVETLQGRGDRILSADTCSGVITGQMFLGPEQGEGYAATIRIADDNSSSAVHLQVKAAWGTLVAPDLCAFYHDYGMRAKRAPEEPQKKEVVLSSPILPEPKTEVPQVRKETAPPVPPPPPSPPAVVLPPPVPTPPSPPPEKAPLTSLPPVHRGTVTWVYVNLRDGPGMTYKVIGKAYKDNTFDIINQNQGWLRVRLENGKEGWMSQKAASEVSKAVPSQNASVSSRDSSKAKPAKKRHEPM